MLTIEILVPEVPDAGENHRQPQAIGSLDYLLISNRPPRLNNCSCASPGNLFNPVREREKRIGRRHRALQWQNRLHSPNLAGVHAAHLPRTHPHSLSVARINDCIRFHMFANFPRKQQSALFFLRRRALTDHLKITFRERPHIRILQQHPARDIFNHPFLRSIRDLHQPQIFLHSEFSLSAGVKFGSANDFKKKLRHFFRSDPIHRTVDANDSPKSRNRIALKRLPVGLDQSRASRRAGGVSVLDNRARRFVELLRQFPSRLQINNIVIRKLFALKLPPIGNASPGAIRIKSSF